MGCCSTRERDPRKEATLFPSKGQSMTKAPNEFFLQVNPNRSAEFYETQNWEQLSLLCYSDHPVQRKVKFRWASPPSTVGSFSMQLLARQASKDATPLLKLLPGLFPLLLHWVNKGADDLRENALLLLQQSLPQWSSDTKKALRDLSPFNVLCRFLMCSRTEICLCIAEICRALHKGQPQTQLAFSNARGCALLVQLLKRSSNDETVLKQLLEHFRDLIMLEGFEMNHLASSRLKVSMAMQVLHDIKTNSCSKQVAAKAEHLLTMLARSFDFS